jgi:hypothetical protein
MIFGPSIDHFEGLSICRIKTYGINRAVQKCFFEPFGLFRGFARETQKISIFSSSKNQLTALLGSAPQKPCQAQHSSKMPGNAATQYNAMLPPVPSREIVARPLGAKRSCASMLFTER